MQCRAKWNKVLYWCESLVVHTGFTLPGFVLHRSTAFERPLNLFCFVSFLYYDLSPSMMKYSIVSATAELQIEMSEICDDKLCGDVLPDFSKGYVIWFLYWAVEII